MRFYIKIQYQNIDQLKTRDVFQAAKILKKWSRNTFIDRNKSQFRLNPMIRKTFAGGFLKNLRLAPS